MNNFTLKHALSCLIVIELLMPAFTGFSQSHDKPDTAIVSKIKFESNARSHVMSILSMLTDVHGPRLTNSQNYKDAAEYAKKELQSWGLNNVHIDMWDEDFGRGWELEKFNLQVVSPKYFPLIAYPKAWSQGTKGAVKGQVIYLDIKKEEDIKKYQGKLRGKIVLFSPPLSTKLGFQPDASRLTDSTLLLLANAPPSEAFTGKRFQPSADPQRLAYLKWNLCMQEGVLAVLEPTARFKDNIVSLGAATVPYPAETPNHKRLKPHDKNAPKTLPQIVVGAEHYNMLVRQIEKGVSPELELTCEVSFTPSSPGYNVIAEIPGTDLKHEVVMVGAHLDSWHTGTGATDNAVGCAVMMDAARVIQSIGKNPRRTIRIALWGGEEQGLLGSSNYARRILGERMDRSYPYDSMRLTEAWKNFSVYFNMDLGSGKFRGIYLQGNENARAVFRNWFKPFEKNGASTITSKNITGTDHLVFDALGLPSFQFIQDPIEYGTTTYHSNLDLFEKAVEGDLKHNVSIIALFAWMSANRDEKFPRK